MGGKNLYQTGAMDSKCGFVVLMCVHTSRKAQQENKYNGKIVTEKTCSMDLDTLLDDSSRFLH